MQRKKKFKKAGRHAYNRKAPVEGETFRVRTPREKQLLGIVDIRLGYGKSRVRCTDGKTRICKVPGALKRRLWVRPGDTVLIEPWELEGEKKANILYKYRPHEAAWLKRNDYLKDLLEQEEF